MEVLEQSSIWKDVGDDMQFDHTKIILREGDDYFYARSPARYRPQDKIDPDQLEKHPIPSAHIWPSFPEDLTRALDPLPDDFYVKVPSLIDYADDDDESFRPRELLLAEARICEILIKFPHPYIARYLGCRVQGNRITGLCFARYKTTLADRLRDNDCQLPPDTYSKIEKGIQHLHSLGLVHNDVNPRNIMFSRDGSPVIIDFDSCKPQGDKLLKGGTWGWCDESARVADRNNDYYGLRKIQKALNGQQKENQTPWIHS